MSKAHRSNSMHGSPKIIEEILEYNRPGYRKCMITITYGKISVELTTNYNNMKNLTSKNFEQFIDKIQSFLKEAYKKADRDKIEKYQKRYLKDYLKPEIEIVDSDKDINSTKEAIIINKIYYTESNIHSVHISYERGYECREHELGKEPIIEDTINNDGNGQFKIRPAVIKDENALFTIFKKITEGHNFSARPPEYKITKKDRVKDWFNAVRDEVFRNSDEENVTWSYLTERTKWLTNSSKKQKLEKEVQAIQEENERLREENDRLRSTNRLSSRVPSRRTSINPEDVPPRSPILGNKRNSINNEDLPPRSPTMIRREQRISDEKKSSPNPRSGYRPRAQNSEPNINKPELPIFVNFPPQLVNESKPIFAQPNFTQSFKDPPTTSIKLNEPFVAPQIPSNNGTKENRENQKTTRSLADYALLIKAVQSIPPLPPININETQNENTTHKLSTEAEDLKKRLSTQLDFPVKNASTSR